MQRSALWQPGHEGAPRLRQHIGERHIEAAELRSRARRHLPAMAPETKKEEPKAEEKKDEKKKDDKVLIKKKDDKK